MTVTNPAFEASHVRGPNGKFLPKPTAPDPSEQIDLGAGLSRSAPVEELALANRLGLMLQDPDIPNPNPWTDRTDFEVGVDEWDRTYLLPIVSSDGARNPDSAAAFEVETSAKDRLAQIEPNSYIKVLEPAALTGDDVSAEATMGGAWGDFLTAQAIGSQIELSWAPNADGPVVAGAISAAYRTMVDQIEELRGPNDNPNQPVNHRYSSTLDAGSQRAAKIAVERLRDIPSEIGFDRLPAAGPVREGGVR